ncbi:Ig-like domain-containing protein [Bacillus sp. B190/17]|uniref:Ig-like domain-containing protein n=1 Tax=Bacillus lumedeiriae TaxID=3058829 RepID=A0ABW8IC60_9BACI
MYKKMTPVAAAVLAAGMMLSGPAYASPKDDAHTAHSTKVKEQENKKDQNKHQDKHQDKQQHGQMKQLQSIDKQLDKIEKVLIKYQTKLTDIEDNDDDQVEDGAETEDKQDAEEQTEEKPADESTTDGEKTEEQPQTDEQPVSETVENKAKASSEEIITNETVQPTEEIEDNELTDTGDQEEAEAEDDDQDADDDEDEVENEVKEHPGYMGKFKALHNRLNAVTKQLDSLSSRGADKAALKERYDRIAALHKDIDAVLAAITQIQDKVKEEIDKDETVEERTPVKNAPVTKEWRIKFSKKLDAATLSELDIVVLDEQRNLVETTFSYSDATKTITVSPLQPYEAGKTYTLYIGKKISDTAGTNLKNSVKMNFTVK